MKFEDIRVYDKDFELLTILPNYIAVNWEIKFSEFGLGEIELEKTEENLSLLTENEYLFMFQGDIQSIVTGYRIAETITVFTRTLEWLLTKFAVGDFTAIQFMQDGLIGDYKKATILECILKNKLHQDFNIKFSGFSDDQTEMKRFVHKGLSDVYSVIKSIIDDGKTGFKFYRDLKAKRFVFSILTTSENTNAVLCDEYKTSYDSQYHYDIQKRASGGLFYHNIYDKGEWNAQTNTPNLYDIEANCGDYYTISEGGYIFGKSWHKGKVIICKNAKGSYEEVEKAEPFLIELPPEENGIFSWVTALEADDLESAQKEMDSIKILDQLTCKTRLSYPEDFKLGDIVVTKYFVKNLSREKKKLITEIHLWDEPDGSGAMPTTKDIT